MKERDILAFGSIVIDNLLIVNKFPALNETIQVEKYRYTFGGAGANVAVAVSRLGGKSGIFAVSGYDFKKMGYEKCLTEQLVDIRGAIFTKEFPMARSFIVSKENSEDQILYYYEKKKRTVQLLFENRNLAEKLSKDYKILHFSTGHFEFYKAFLEKHKTKHLISFDPGQETFSYPYRVVRLLKYTNILFMNNHEAKRIKEVLKIKSIKQLRGPSLICVSLGAEGSIILYKEKVYRIPAVKPSKVIDPTGAGDSHRAGFLVALLKGYDIKTAGRIASTVASFTIEAEGAQTSLPTWEKVVRRYEHFFKEPFPEPSTSWKETEKELLSRN
ncbi:carbohydrate kinase family protein [Desulfurobacterium atlanticum]|uniref:Inosine-guanosine kinase /cytidine kinase n=1 Tax=Desulfurobacterium atlanticum TaxID=240169 RepID=A0A238ZIR0_9BACT|nr:carbohydrate kinase family protein [Desulfurobacterium atlanticum]SNR82594.1 inosine-guanosine kinase /cytidine kinase [Desulfurobacterium atlanticum]